MNPGFAMVIVVTGHRVGTAEKCPANAPVDAVIKADLVVSHDLFARVGRHGDFTPGATVRRQGYAGTLWP